MPTNTYPYGSVDYVSATLTEASGRDLSTATPVLAIHRGDPTTWLPCTWPSAGVVRTTTPVTFGAAFTASSYTVSVKLADTPEAPIIRVGYIQINH